MNSQPSVTCNMTWRLGDPNRDSESYFSLRFGSLLLAFLLRPLRRVFALHGDRVDCVQIGQLTMAGCR